MHTKGLRPTFRSLLFFLTFAIAVSLTASADTIRLKNGQTVVGKIVSYSDRKFIIVYEKSSSDTRATISLEDIDGVEFDGRPLPSSYPSGYGETGARSEPPALPVRTEPPPSREPVRDHTPSYPTTGGSLGSSGNSGTPATPSVVFGREILVNVAAREDWTYANTMVQKGDRIRISADGTVRLNSRLECSPDGTETEDPNKLLPQHPTGALIAVIGEDNDDFIFIGKYREFTAQRSGKLFLSVNEGDLSDNTGGFSARVQIGK